MLQVRNVSALVGNYFTDIGKGIPPISAWFHEIFPSLVSRVGGGGGNTQLLLPWRSGQLALWDDSFCISCKGLWPLLVAFGTRFHTLASRVGVEKIHHHSLDV